MEGRKSELLQRIESDREVLLDFLRCFIRCQSPNPPGDTREAADHIRHGHQRRRGSLVRAGDGSGGGRRFPRATRSLRRHP
jgi:hypothetical protein